MYGSPLRPTTFAVYASVVLFGLAPEFRPIIGQFIQMRISATNCNTRYGRLVRTYPTGTFTLQEHQSLAWRTLSKPEIKSIRLAPAGTPFSTKKSFPDHSKKLLGFHLSNTKQQFHSLSFNPPFIFAKGVSLKSRCSIFPIQRAVY